MPGVTGKHVSVYLMGLSNFQRRWVGAHEKPSSYFALYLSSPPRWLAFCFLINNGQVHAAEKRSKTQLGPKTIFCLDKICETEDRVEHWCGTAINNYFEIITPARGRGGKRGSKRLTLWLVDEPFYPLSLSWAHNVMNQILLENKLNVARWHKHQLVYIHVVIALSFNCSWISNKALLIDMIFGFCCQTMEQVR